MKNGKIKNFTIQISENSHSASYSCKMFKLHFVILRYNFNNTISSSQNSNEKASSSLHSIKNQSKMDRIPTIDRTIDSEAADPKVAARLATNGKTVT